MTRRYLGNTFYSLIFFVIQSLVTLWASPLIINSLGKHNYGIIVIVNSFSIFGWLSLMDLGLQGALTKHLAETLSKGGEGRDKSLMLFQSSLFLYVFSGTVACAAVLICSHFPTLFSVDATQHRLISNALIIVAAFNMILFPLLSIAAVAEGLQEYRAIKIISTLVLIVWSAAVIILINLKAGVLAFLFIDYAKTTLQYALMILLVKNKLPWLVIALKIPQLSEIKSLINLSVDLFVSRITGIIFNQTDVLLITFFIGQTAIVSDYYSANALFISVLGIAAVFNSVVISETAWLSGEAHDYTSGISGLAEVGTKVTSAYVLPVATFVFVWAPDILRIWLGTEFEKNGLLLRIMIIAMIPIASSGVTSTLLVGIDRLRGALWIPILSVFVNLSISVMGIKPLGIIALGIGTTLAYFMGSFLYNRYCLAILKINSANFYIITMAKPLLVSSCCGTVGYLFKGSVVVNNLFQLGVVALIFLGICYGLVLALSKYQERRELLAVVGFGRA